MIFRSTDGAASAAEASSVSERTKSSLPLPGALFSTVCEAAYEYSLSLSSLADPHAAKKVAKHRRENSNGKRIFILRWYYKMILRASLAVKGHSPENLSSLVVVSSALSPAFLSTKRDRELETRRSHEENACFGRMLKTVGQPDAEITERTGFDHGGMVSPAFPSLPWFVQNRTTDSLSARVRPSSFMPTSPCGSMR